MTVVNFPISLAAGRGGLRPVGGMAGSRQPNVPKPRPSNPGARAQRGHEWPNIVR